MLSAAPRMSYQSLYRPDTSTTTMVCWRCLGSDGAVLPDQRYAAGYMCFSPLTYSPIPKEVATIVVLHSWSRVPYSPDVAARWLREITELGFPASLRSGAPAGTMEVALHLSSYSKKAHLVFALQLVRTLTETGICYTPDEYFRLASEAQDQSVAARFLLLQEAHVAAYARACKGAYAAFNSNHTVMTVLARGAPRITHARLFGRLAKSPFGVRDNHLFSVSDPGSHARSYGSYWNAELAD